MERVRAEQLRMLPPPQPADRGFVTAVGPVNRAPQRIAVGAQVAYADKTLDSEGRFWRKRARNSFLTYV